jgi:hypothetical protein
VIIGVAFLVLWLDPTRVLWGGLRGEAFFQGRPTSYWRWELIESRKCVVPMGSIPVIQPPDTTINRFRTWVGIEPTYLAAPAVTKGDIEAIPVLVELLNDVDEDVRAEAVDLLNTMLVFHRLDAARAALRSALQSTHRDVRWRAAERLQWVDSEAAAVLIPIFVEWLQNDDWQRREAGARALERLGPKASEAGPALIEALRREDPELPHLRNWMEAALRAIRPEEAARVDVDG